MPACEKPPAGRAYVYSQPPRQRTDRCLNDEIDYSTGTVYHHKLRDFLLMDEL